jgi:hypothetical protein
MNIINPTIKDSETNSQLHKKLNVVLASPFKSAERARAMNRLICAVQCLPGIRKTSHQDYLLALNQTWDWMSRNIDKFQSSTDSLENDLVKWINGHLSWRIQDLYYPPTNKQEPLSLDNQVFEEGNSYLDFLSDDGIGFNLSGLGEYVDILKQQEEQRIAVKIEEWIEFDPTQELKSCHPRGQKLCDCQLIAYRILMKDPPDSFTEIARNINVPYQTLIAHWKRKCLPILKTQAKKFGYECD